MGNSTSKWTVKALLNRILNTGEDKIKVEITEIQLTEGSILEFKDHRGFVIGSFDEVTGDFRIKGDFIKI